MLARSKTGRIWTVFPGNGALHWPPNELVNLLRAMDSDS